MQRVLTSKQPERKIEHVTIVNFKLLQTLNRLLIIHCLI